MKRIQRIIFIILIAILLAACGPFTLVPVATRTFYTTTTPSLTPTVTWTPLPTLSARQARVKINELLGTNGGCELPCWWGITPGETSWHDASRFLKTFSTVKSGNEFGITRPNNDYTYHFAYFQVLPEFGTLNHSYVVKDDVVTRIYAYVHDWSPFLYLSNILTEYGPPDGVFLTTYRYELNGARPYLVYFVYEKLGLLLEYSGGVTKNIGDTVQNCFEELDSPFVYIWSTGDEPLTAEEAIEKYFRQPMAYPVDLEKAAGVDINTFYEKFKTPSNTNCLVMPSELWTEP